MSIANLEVPNNFDLFCDSLTANVLNIIDQNVTNITCVNLTSTGLITGNSQILSGSLGMSGDIISNVAGSTAFSATNTANPMTSALIFANAGPDTTSSQGIMGYTSQQANSHMDLKNTNAASTSNGLIIYNQANTPVLQVGSNNSTATSYIISSIPINITYPNYVQNQWTATISGSGGGVVFTIPTVANTTYGLTLISEGKMTVGSNVGDARYTTLVALFKNISGTVTQVGTQTAVYNLTDTSMASYTPGFSISGTSILMSIGGSSGVTIQWSGVYIIYTS